MIISKSNRVTNWVKNNVFISSLTVIYVILLAIAPEMSLQGVKNSGYYIKEMLMIMPVIFVLTALLDTWIPKETIMKVLGKEAKSKGVLFSFILGSISAGPIYAAFPLCGMLLNKGASIRNIVIILSSWAVVKIPMLLNEAKFLGGIFYGLEMATHHKCHIDFFMVDGSHCQRRRSYEATENREKRTYDSSRRLYGMFYLQ